MVTKANTRGARILARFCEKTSGVKYGKQKDSHRDRSLGAAVVQAFLGRGYNVVATSRSVSNAGFAPSPNLALVDGDIGQAATAEKVAQAAIGEFASIDHVVSR